MWIDPPKKKIIVSEPHRKTRKLELFEAVVGHRLAINLGIDLNSQVALVGSQFDGSIGAIIVKIVGIYNSSNVELDSSRIYIPLRAGREFYSPDAPEKGIVRFTSIALGIKDYRVAENVLENLRKKFPTPKMEPNTKREDSDNYDPVIINWTELNPGIVQWTTLDQISGELWASFLILIMAFGVLNNVQTSIHERTREFGILLAIGTPPRSLFIMIIYEVIMTLLPGIFIGSLLGMGAGYYFEANPIVLTGDNAKSFVDMGVVPVMTALVDSSQLIIAVLSLGLPSIILTFFAARRIYRMNPVDIINTL